LGGYAMAIRTLRSMVDELVRVNCEILDAYVRDKLDEHDMLEVAERVHNVRSQVETNLSVAKSILRKIS